MDCFTETEGKMEQDPLMDSPRSAARATATGIPVGDQGVAVLPGPLIVGAGPAGLACAARLTMGSVPYALLERDVCVASMWHRRTYRRLCLHLPKRYCELPLMPFPCSYPTYPTKQQFLAYIDEYMRTFGIRPFFRQEVIDAEHDGEYWCVRTKDVIAGPINGGGEESIHSSAREYRSKWLIVATGENAEPVVPEIEGIHSFKGQVMHSSEYRSGEAFQGKKVLVVGCGNSGMEVSLDLANHNVHTSIVVRDSVRNYTVYFYYQIDYYYFCCNLIIYSSLLCIYIIPLLIAGSICFEYGFN
jgi:cation diffusion facilitator CzcD-associated flavoprotein CzcO